MKRFLGAWLLLTLLGSLVVHQLARIDRLPPPDEASLHWAMQTLERLRRAQPPEQAPASAGVGEHTFITLAWWKGRVQGRHVSRGSLAKAVKAAAAAFSNDADLGALPGFQQDSDNPVRFTVTRVDGTASLLRGLPYLSSLSVVPLVEGVMAELAGQRAFLTPDEIWAAGLWDTAVRTPIPDLSFGLDLDVVTKRLAHSLGVEPEQLVRQGRLRRFAATTLQAEPYPSRDSNTGVDRATLEAAARQGARFLIRHQRRDGRYTYVYDGQRNRRARRGYNLPRHSGTTYFLAQAARLLDMAEAREAATKALRFIERQRLGRCGGNDRMCVVQDGQADMGAAALTSLAASELLRAHDNAPVRGLLEGLNAFIRSMQRPDGELMHVYDVAADAPVDVQKMYYSGEAAYALLNSHRALGDERDLKTARRLMGHLTGAAWSFFGSRYFYGEEHWTCQAAGQAADRMPVEDALDFCLRWLAWQRQLLYERGQTPWPVAGAVGVGPLVVPRITAVASRVEAGAMIYRAARARGYDVSALREQIEASLGLLLRMRWAPGPTHLLANPAAALGGFPATQASLEVRNDFVQHAGSAMLLWAEILSEEAQATALR